MSEPGIRHAGVGQPALLLVDFARAYFNTSSPLFGGEGCLEAVRNVERLLEKARNEAIPVIFTEVRYKKGGQDGGVFFGRSPLWPALKTTIHLPICSHRWNVAMTRS